MNALLIVTIIAMQGDGSITRQRDMFTFKSMEECRERMHGVGAAMRAIKPPVIGGEVRCEEMATLEVIEPPKKKDDGTPPANEPRNELKLPPGPRVRS